VVAVYVFFYSDDDGSSDGVSLCLHGLFFWFGVVLGLWGFTVLLQWLYGQCEMPTVLR
jgi:hypothetical protein